jgi:hypothetical protein
MRVDREYSDSRVRLSAPVAFLVDLYMQSASSPTKLSDRFARLHLKRAGYNP